MPLELLRQFGEVLSVSVGLWEIRIPAIVHIFAALDPGGADQEWQSVVSLGECFDTAAHPLTSMLSCITYVLRK